MPVFQLSDPTGTHSVDFRLDASQLSRKAIDIVFDVIGASPDHLQSENVIRADEKPKVEILQKALFGEDEQGKYIRDDVRIIAGGRDIDPDRPLRDAFPPASDACQARIERAGESGGIDDRIMEFGKMLLLHHIAEGRPLDVTVDHPEIQELIAWAEKDQLIEIDVKRAAYKLTDRGKRLHQEILDEAQELIRKYDIFGDVDVDTSGTAYFDTKLGKDLRVPIFELERIDPFRARFLIGLNDGEWNDEDLAKIALNANWYSKVFAPIESSPTIEEIGRDKLVAALDQGRAKLRREAAGN
jgi:hypothetical protein